MQYNWLYLVYFNSILHIVNSKSSINSLISFSNHNLNKFTIKPISTTFCNESPNVRKLLDLYGGNKDSIETELNNEEEEDGEEDDNEKEQLSPKQPNPFVLSISDTWKKTPPITQYFIAGSISITLLSLIFNNNNWPEFLHLDWNKFIIFQFWRPFTAFLYFGPFGINYILTIQFVWTYMAQLEKLNHKNPENFFLMIAFGAISLMTIYSILGFSTKFLGHNLSTYLVYIWARVFEGSEVNFMDFFTLKAELLPWFFCAQAMLVDGEIPYADLIGIAVGHLYHYFIKQNIIKAPEILKKWFDKPNIKSKYSRFKDEFQ